MASTPTAVSYVPVTFADLPGWAADDHAAALVAFQNSCERVNSVAGRDFGHLSDGKADSGTAKAFFETHFVPHRVLHAGTNGILTGYYEPLLEGSRKLEDNFRIPVYRRPPDLLTLVQETQIAPPGQTLTHVRVMPGGKSQPYPTRAEIEAGALRGRGLELIYVKDVVELFFMQVQGSGRINLTDGSTIRIGYDGKNGHPYTSIGRYLVDNKLMSADEVSLESLAQWLRADPERGRRVMTQNASYVFFKEQTGDQAASAIGAHEIPLTPGRSLAVDGGIHALGLPIYVSSPTLTHVDRGTAFNRLMIAQDVGAAIKGPERGDIYLGSGPAAGKLAGIIRHPGNLFVLLPAQPVPFDPATAMTKAPLDKGGSEQQAKP